MMAWHSPISPGVSWYEESIDDRPEYPPLDGSVTASVAIVGGGYTGLQAAHNLAKAGVDVVLLDANRFGDGASGRNGGQFGTGQRWWPEEYEEEFGLPLSKSLFDMAENAKHYVLNFASENKFDIDYVQGHMVVGHKKRFEKYFRANPDIAAERYNYPHLHFMEKDETATRLGSARYHFGVYDKNTGHIHPMKLVVGLARAAQAAGAKIHEKTAATKISSENGKVRIETERGTITADKALVATDAYTEKLEPVTSTHVLPIGSFIGSTPPLDNFPPILPGKESVADSRFVVRYFRKTKDNRLLFGGREIYSSEKPNEIADHIRRQVAEIYPALADIPLTHAWGGYVGITMPRFPFVRQVAPGITAIGGYSGHGVMLANYCGKLYADMLTGKETELELFRGLKVPAFPGGRKFQAPLLFLALNWYALMDKI
jgi:gamma-glutamylputrescine oxidase